MKRTLYLIITTFIASITFAQTKNASLYKPGQTLKDCKNCPEMVVIPAGNFMMGSPENEQGSFPEEKPQHQVSIQQFACGKFDITKKEWAVFVKETGRPATGGCSWATLPGDTGKPWNPNPAANWNHIGFVQDSSHPVVCITWQDAKDYISWLNNKTGFTYRLLSEAEWEYVARAGTTSSYPWGKEADHNYANYGADSGYTGLLLGKDKWMNTSPVGSFAANSFGVYDITGNVNQYLEDCFSLYNAGMPADGTAFKADVQLKMTGDLSYMNGTSSCSYRIVRGGNYGDPPGMLRSAYRNWSPGPGSTLETYSSAALSFRVARTF